MQGKFAEANPYDTIWGTGIALKDDRILDPTSWTGTNWLGDILTDLYIVRLTCTNNIFVQNDIWNYVTN